MTRFFILLLTICFSISLKAQILSIPYEEKNGWPIIKVDIEGKEYDFLFDTGAAISLFDRKYFDRKNNIGEVTSEDISGKKNKERLVSVNQLTIGGMMFKNVVGLNNDNLSQQHHFMCDVKLQGIIGVNVLRNYVVEINPISQKINLYKPNTVDKKILNEYSKYKYKAQGNNTRPHISVIIDKIKTELVFDTGSTGYLGIPNNGLDKFVNNYKNGVMYSEGRRGLYGADKKVDRRVFVSEAPMKIGNLKIEKQSFILEDNLTNNIGFQFIKEFSTYIDFYNRTVYLKKINQESSYEMKELVLGFGININEEGKVYINSINTDNKLLQLEDVLLKINDQELPLSFCDIKEFFKQFEGFKEQNKFTILRGNKEIDIDYTYKLN